ncbi:MAG: type VI secretion system tube protein Hcp [Pseudonocardiaceae bacterium]
MTKIGLTRGVCRPSAAIASSAFVAVAVLGAGASSGPASAPAAQAMSLAQLQLAAFTGNATIEMVITGGGTIKGENPDGSIAVSTLSWGVKHPAPPIAGPPVGRATFDPITITKNVDSATTGLLQADAAGSTLTTVVIYIKPANADVGGDPTTWPLRLTLAPAAVTSVEESANTTAASAPEVVTMTTTKETFRYQPPNGAPQTFSWNVVTNRPS